MTTRTTYAPRSSRAKREAHWLRRLHALVPRAKQRVRLTREEEQELARRWYEERDAEAREKLITSYFGLAVWAASKFRGLGVAMEDLVQEACRGLVRAADRFEPGRGVRFTTFAVTWMKGVLRNAIVKRGGLVRMPPHEQRRLHERWAVQAGYATRGRALQAWQARGARMAASLDLNELANLPDHHDLELERANEELRQQLRRAVAQLPKRHQMVLQMRFGLYDGEEHSLQEIGDVIGRSHERVRQLEEICLTKLGWKLRAYVQE